MGQAAHLHLQLLVGADAENFKQRFAPIVGDAFVLVFLPRGNAQRLIHQLNGHLGGRHQQNFRLFNLGHVLLQSHLGHLVPLHLVQEMLDGNLGII